MVWYFNMQGREVVSINARLEDLATIDAFCKKRNISRSSLMVRAALAFCAAKKGKPIQFRGLHTQQRGGGMSAAAAGYVLKVPTDRRELLLDEAENGGSFYRSTLLLRNRFRTSSTAAVRRSLCLRRLKTSTRIR